jgi:hypothetical protein
VEYVFDLHAVPASVYVHSDWFVLHPSVGHFFVSQSANIGENGVPYVPIAMPCPCVLVICSVPDEKLLQDLASFSSEVHVDERNPESLMSFYSVKEHELDKRLRERAAIESRSARGAWSGDKSEHKTGLEPKVSACVSSRLCLVVCRSD